MSPIIFVAPREDVNSLHNPTVSEPESDSMPYNHILWALFAQTDL